MFLAIRKSQEPIEQIPLSKSMQETADEFEETLSFCDLALYSPAAESNRSNSFWTSDHDQDCFEFFSEESADSSFPPEKNIVFCGKIITPRKPISENNQTPDENKAQKGNRKWQIFRRKTSSTHKTSQKNLQKVSVLTSSPSGKSRWYLLLFGITRFPTGMELRDMKNRQSRRRRDPLPPMFQFKSGDEKANHVETNIWSGVWGLIKALSCTGGSHQMNAVVPRR